MLGGPGEKSKCTIYQYSKVNYASNETSDRENDSLERKISWEDIGGRKKNIDGWKWMKWEFNVRFDQNREQTGNTGE